MSSVFISDIHGNLAALEAVLADIDTKAPNSKIYCLGDTVGYGPDPRACLDLVMQHCRNTTILGNHDYAAIGPEERSRGFRSEAREAIRWTHRCLKTKDGRYLKFLESLPRLIRSSLILMVHGSPRDYTFEYVTQSDVYDNDKMNALWREPFSFAFQGHTHVAGIFLPPESQGGESVFIESVEVGDRGFDIRGKRQHMINVGSVGQPRDGNPKACYLRLADGRIYFHRVGYDIERTIQRMAEEDLPTASGARLRKGR